MKCPKEWGAYRRSPELGVLSFRRLPEPFHSSGPPRMFEALSDGRSRNSQTRGRKLAAAPRGRLQPLGRLVYDLYVVEHHVDRLRSLTDVLHDR